MPRRFLISPEPLEIFPGHFLVYTGNRENLISMSLLPFTLSKYRFPLPHATFGDVILIFFSLAKKSQILAF